MKINVLKIKRWLNIVTALVLIVTAIGSLIVIGVNTQNRIVLLENEMNKLNLSNQNTLADILTMNECLIELKNNQRHIIKQLDRMLDYARQQVVYDDKKALLIGVNEYVNLSWLKGPVNDVMHMYNVLVQVYKVKPANIKILLNGSATKADIVDGINWLLSNNTSNTELLFYFSGHGAQTEDFNGDEYDKLDEFIVPYDAYMGDTLMNILIDDEIASYFKKRKNKLTAIFDSCYSGTMTDGAAEIEFTGCRDDQVSWERPLLGKSHGFASYLLLHLLTVNPDLTWKQIHVLMNAVLGEWQNPQVTGAEIYLDQGLFTNSIKINPILSQINLISY